MTSERTTVLRLPTTERAARDLTERLGEVLDPAEAAVSAFERPDGAWLLEVFFASPPDQAAVRSLVAEVAGAEAAPAFEAVEARDWVRASLEGLHPVRAGRFLVHGAHDRARVKPNDRAVEVEAALAFGTGHHGTTRGCLLALDAALKRTPRPRALDVGTGTGVLALALARATRRAVAATDLDAESVRVAAANARLNGLHGLVRPLGAAGTRHRAIRGRFGLVVANILARPLMRLAPELSARLAPGGTLVLSGLQPRDVRGVVAAYRGRGLALTRRRELEGWATLAFTAPRRPEPDA